MSQQPPEGPEYYTPEPQATPSPPPPPSIGEAAAQWDAAQAGEPGELQAAPPAWNAYPAGAAQPTPYAYAAPPQAPTPSGGMAVTALVLGIIAVVSGWIPGWGIFIGLIAVIFGVIALAKKQSKGMAIAGIVTGALGALTSVIVLIFTVVLVNTADDYYQDFGDYGNETTLGAEPVDSTIAIGDQAFGRTTWDDTVWWFVVVLDNTGEALPATDITVKALDASGAVIDESWTYVGLPAGTTAISGTFYEVGSAEIAGLAVVGPDGASGAGQVPSGALEIGPLTATSDEYSTTVTGNVTSTFAEDLYAPSITVVATGPDGKILGAATAWLETVSSGGTEEFEAFFYEPLPEGTTYTAYWTTY
jgi:hypothetical protein